MVKHRSFLELKTDIFFIDPQKTKVDQNCYTALLKTSLLSECRRLYPGNDFVFMQDTVLRHSVTVTPRKSDATVSATEHSRLHSCWWMGIICSRSWPLRLLHLGYPAGFGVRMLTTSVCKSAGPQRGNQKQMERSRHWDSSKIHCTMEKNYWVRLESRMEARFSTFTANRCDWILISCSKTTCWT